MSSPRALFKSSSIWWQDLFAKTIIYCWFDLFVLEGFRPLMPGFPKAIPAAAWGTVPGTVLRTLHTTGLCSATCVLLGTDHIDVYDSCLSFWKGAYQMEYLLFMSEVLVPGRPDVPTTVEQRAGSTNSLSTSRITTLQKNICCFWSCFFFFSC